MSYELVFRANVGDYGPLETASAQGIARFEHVGGLRHSDRGKISSPSEFVARYLLSESDAAARMGVSEARLREVSDFHRELMRMGCRPFGRAPERIGGQCFYSTETLDHWFSDPA